MSNASDLRPEVNSTNTNEAVPVVAEERTINGLSVKHAWRLRRLAIVLFSIVTLVYTLKVSFFVEKVLPIHEQTVATLIGGTTYLLISWIFGAVLDDNWRKKYLKV